MKVKIIKYIPTGAYGFHVSFEVGQIIAVDEEVAMQVIKDGYAEPEV